MWIICEDGLAINTDHVARFREKEGLLVADIPGLAVQSQIICKTKHYNIYDILKSLISDEKIMEVN